MALAACYDLTLYCDAEYPQVVKLYPEVIEVKQCNASWNSSGMSQTFAQAAKEARQSGWTVRKQTRQALCPTCKRAGRTIADPPTEWHR